MRIRFLLVNNCVFIKTQYLCQDEFFNEESIAKLGISLSLKNAYQSRLLGTAGSPSGAVKSETATRGCRRKFPTKEKVSAGSFQSQLRVL